MVESKVYLFFIRFFFVFFFIFRHTKYVVMMIRFHENILIYLNFWFHRTLLHFRSNLTKINHVMTFIFSLCSKFSLFIIITGITESNRISSHSFIPLPTVFNKIRRYCLILFFHFAVFFCLLQVFNRFILV